MSNNNTRSVNSNRTIPMNPRNNNNNGSSNRTIPMNPRNNNNNGSSNRTIPMNPQNNNNTSSVSSIENVFEFIQRNTNQYGFDVFCEEELNNIRFLEDNTPEEFVFDRDYGVLNHHHRGMPIVLDDILKILIFKRKRLTDKQQMRTIRSIRKYYNFYIPNRVSNDIFRESEDIVIINEQLNVIYKEAVVQKAIQQPNKHFIIRVDPRIAKVTNLNTKELTDVTLLNLILYTRYNLYITELIQEQFNDNEEYYLIYERDTGLISGYSNNLSIPLEPNYTYTEPNIRYQYVIPMEHPLVKEYINKFLKANKIVPSTNRNNRLVKRARYETPLEVSGGGHIKFINNRDLL